MDWKLDQLLDDLQESAVLSQWLDKFDYTNRVVWMIGDIVTNGNGKENQNVCVYIIYIYTYTYVCIYIRICIYMCVYIYTQQEIINMLSSTGFRFTAAAANLRVV